MSSSISGILGNKAYIKRGKIVQHKVPQSKAYNWDHKSCSPFLNPPEPRGALLFTQGGIIFLCLCLCQNHARGAESPRTARSIFPLFFFSFFLTKRSVCTHGGWRLLAENKARYLAQNSSVRTVDIPQAPATRRRRRRPPKDCH